MIRGITFAEQAFYSADFAHYQNFFMDGKNGITKGCQITNDGSKVTIGTGYFIVQGRMMNAETETEITSSSGFKDGYNRIVYTIDLSKTNTVTEFNQGFLEVLHDTNLVQEDLYEKNSKYQYPLCSFQWNGSAISSFNIECASISLDNIFAEIEANWEVIKAEQEAWFADNKTEVETWFANQKNAFIEFFDAQEAEILRMIEELKDRDFASHTELNAFKAEVTETLNEMTAEFSATLPAGDWTQNSAGYWYKSITVTGLKTSDTPIIDLVASLDNYEAEQEAWGLVFKAHASTNHMTFYATANPETPVNIFIKVVR